MDLDTMKPSFRLEGSDSQVHHGNDLATLFNRAIP